MTPENRQGWTRTILALVIVVAFIISNFINANGIDGLKELAFIAVTFYFAKNDN